MDEPPTPPPDQPLPEPPQPGLSAGRGWEPPPGEPMRPAGNPQGWLVLAGGILVLVGVFLPWFTVGAGGVTQTTTGTSEWGLLLLGAFATGRGLSMVQPARFRLSLGTPLIGGVILTILVWSRWNDLHQLLDRYTEAGLTASIGIGFWAVVAGTACVLIGGVLSLRRRT